MAPLRVGVATEVPPYAFRQRGGQVSGLEVDFARALAEALGRPLELVEARFEDQIPVLLGRRSDIIMAGMTITRARQVTIAFSDPYLRSGLGALVRRTEEARYPGPAAVLASPGPIGVVSGTTGERWVRERMPAANILGYAAPGDALVELVQRRVDIVIHDAPVILWLGSQREADVAPVLALLNDEPLGWGMRRDDPALVAAVNDVLARWNADGTRDAILSRWLPYWSRLEQAPRGR